MATLARHPHLARLLQHETLAGGRRLTPILERFIGPAFARAEELIAADPNARRWSAEQIPHPRARALPHRRRLLRDRRPLRRRARRGPPGRARSRAADALPAASSCRPCSPIRPPSRGEEIPMDVRVPYLQPESWDVDDAGAPALAARERSGPLVRARQPLGAHEVRRRRRTCRSTRRSSRPRRACGRERRPRSGSSTRASRATRQLRRLINRGFTPRMVAKLEETFLAITTDAHRRRRRARASATS